MGRNKHAKPCNIGRSRYNDAHMKKHTLIHIIMTIIIIVLVILLVQKKGGDEAAGVQQYGDEAQENPADVAVYGGTLGDFVGNYYPADFNAAQGGAYLVLASEGDKKSSTVMAYECTAPAGADAELEDCEAWELDRFISFDEEGKELFMYTPGIGDAFYFSLNTGEAAPRLSVWRDAQLSLEGVMQK